MRGGAPGGLVCCVGVCGSGGVCAHTQAQMKGLPGGGLGGNKPPRAGWESALAERAGRPRFGLWWGGSTL